ncbi:uncharacterized protein V6R79_019217 [Siganus canaliculatus]
MKLCELGSHSLACPHKPSEDMAAKDVRETVWITRHSADSICQNPGDMLQYEDGESLLQSLEQVAVHYASEIHLSPRDARLHFLLCLVLEEQQYAAEMFGLQRKLHMGRLLLLQGWSWETLLHLWSAASEDMEKKAVLFSQQGLEHFVRSVRPSVQSQLTAYTGSPHLREATPAAMVQRSAELGKPGAATSQINPLKPSNKPQLPASKSKQDCCPGAQLIIFTPSLKERTVQVHAAYTELARLLEPSDPQAAVKVYSRFLVNPTAEQSFSDTFITGEIIHLLMMLEQLDHPQLDHQSFFFLFVKDMNQTYLQTHSSLIECKTYLK